MSTNGEIKTVGVVGAGTMATVLLMYSPSQAITLF